MTNDELERVAREHMILHREQRGLARTPNDEFINGFLAGHDHASRWIPVAERLPTENDCYLCIIYDRGTAPSETYPSVESWFNNEGWLTDSTVVFWKPIVLPTEGK